MNTNKDNRPFVFTKEILEQLGGTFEPHRVPNWFKYSDCFQFDGFRVSGHRWSSQDRDYTRGIEVHRPENTYCIRLNSLDDFKNFLDMRKRGKIIGDEHLFFESTWGTEGSRLLREAHIDGSCFCETDNHDH